MRLYDIITKKKHGEALTEEEIRFVIDGYTKGEVPDYQVSSLLMAICLNGMDDFETFILTDAIMRSGDVVDLSEFGDTTADKHSTGGVGDKTTLIVAPTVASLGVKVAKMSGRGLGHTGGTVDKLESMDGFKTSLTPEEFKKQVNEIGIAVIGQSGNLAPADKKLYALRDVTATVDSIPLIASSIMGKKLAAGTKSIVLDVKYGSGGFMKTAEDATKLAEKMVDIGVRSGRRVAALITSMDTPLGYNIGNSLEVIEAIEVLKGKGPEDLRTVALELASNIVSLALGKDINEARELVRNAIDSGLAFETFKKWIVRQGADIKYALDKNSFKQPKYSYTVKSKCSGYISKINTEEIGIASVVLGGGRVTKDDLIDFSAGIDFRAKCGLYFNEGDVIATLYTDNEAKLKEAEEKILSAIQFSSERVKAEPLIYKLVSGER